jgi:hypothetical protein
VISRIYDQTKFKNHLDIAPPGGAHRETDAPVNATKDPLMVGGHKVYSAYFEGGMGYRIDNTTNIAVHDEPETIYMVTSGKHFNNRCCFDYGNAETDNNDDGPGTMEALYFGNAKGGLNHGGAGKGPWIMADMENALWGADVVVSNEEPINHEFVTAMVKGDSAKSTGPGPYQQNIDHGGSDVAPCNRDGCILAKTATHDDCAAKCKAASGCAGYVFAPADCSGKAGPICWTKGELNGKGTSAQCRNSQALEGFDQGHWAIKGGDSQTGALKIYWDGKRAPNYSPMKKQGGTCCC